MRFVQNMEYVKIIEPHQQGKTSLINWLVARPSGHTFVRITLTTLDRSSEKSWYSSLCRRLLLHLPPRYKDDYLALPAKGDEWNDFLMQIAKRASNIGDSIVVILDELGAAQLPWAEDFFSPLKALHDNRGGDPYLKRLAFMIVGTCNTNDLVRNPICSPFNICQQVRLKDFNASQVGQLVTHLGLSSAQTDQVATWIYEWTDGQPYLTQWACNYLFRVKPPITREVVNDAIAHLCAEDGNHLPRVVERLIKKPDLLDSIRRVQEGYRRGERIEFNPEIHPVHMPLNLIGILKGDERGFCRVRNRIYEKVLEQLEELPPVVPGRNENTPSEENVPTRIFGNAHSLLIGAGSYLNPRFVNLPATVRDAQAINAILTDPARCGYPPGNVHVMTGPDATAANIRTSLRSLAQSTSPQSTVFLYFSGHGGRALESGNWRTYLCPREADPDDLVHTAISGDEFSELLAAIPARKLLVMLDACHAGGSAELKAADGTLVWKAGLPEAYYEALSQGSGRVIIASSKENQFSYIRPRGDLSLFTYHLLQALGGRAAVRGDGLIHVLDVFHHVNEAVQSDEPRQIPILKVKDLDLNFPIAMAPAQTSEVSKTSKVSRDMAAIREQIVHNPISGAKALSSYLASHPEWAPKQAEVDLKRADLEHIQHDLDLFGPNPDDQAAKNRAVYFLLRVCLEVEQ